MITDLVQIRRLGEKKREENLRFRMHLKRTNHVERRLKAIAQEVEDQIDCTTCANCCKVAEVQLQERDAVKLAKYLRISERQFVANYVEQSDDGTPRLKRTDAGCVFLDGTQCTVYDVRPATCEHFPHVVKGAGSLISRLWQMPDRATYCPIVYNTLELWKAETGFSPIPK